MKIKPFHPKLLEKMFSGSISRKYGIGYVLIFVLMIVVFLGSFGSTAFVSRLQNKALDDLLILNELFVDVETIDRYVYDCFTYLRPSSIDGYHASTQITEETVGKVRASLEKNYSRDVMDLTCMVETYLEQSDRLVEALSTYHEGELQDNTEMQTQYDTLGDTIGFINHSFKSIYSAKLISTQQLQKQMQNITDRIYTFQVIVVLIAVIVFLVFHQRVLRDLTDSVNKLTRFANGVASGQRKQEHVVINTSDELAVFADTFNEMLDTIQLQMNQLEKDSRMRQQLQDAEVKNMRISSALQQSQLRLLQARINPHFLFNTLNMISQTAYLENAEETAELIETTAELLRYNLGKMTTPVTLGAEMKNTQDYVTIQQRRFGKRIQVEFCSDGACEQQEVPCLILQPLVENSITHGIGDRVSGGKVTVRLFRKGDRACLEVEDNGIGFDSAVMEELRGLRSTGEINHQHIGLRNVFQRLMLYYNNDVDFVIDSNSERTVVHMGLPW